MKSKASHRSGRLEYFAEFGHSFTIALMSAIACIVLGCLAGFYHMLSAPDTRLIEDIDLRRQVRLDIAAVDASIVKWTAVAAALAVICLLILHLLARARNR